MAIIDPVRALCARLNADSVWSALMTKHGMNLAAPDLATALRAPLTIKRDLIGFGDFANDGVRAIEPGSPSRSLLYHAIASPNVLRGPLGMPLTVFPTMAEIDSLENYIFGVSAPTLPQIQARFPGQALSVVVFSSEYRPASQSTHRRHADLAFARTGVARVGTRPPRFVPEFRGFFPELPTEPFGIGVLPARYVAYLAVRLPGKASEFRPMRALDSDTNLQFWIPVHKLFPGTECIAGLNLTVTFSANHVNEKIFRAQTLLGNNPPNASPYRFSDGLAKLSSDPNHGPGWIIPTDHPHLVAEAKTPAGADVTFTVPTTPGNWATVDLWALSHSQSGPEYLHARTEVLANGTRRNLNDFNNPPDLPVDQRVRAGHYKALHYVDFTADGEVGVDCPQVQGVGGVSASALPAYSLVAAPDFFPSCDQRELIEWYQSNSVPTKLKQQIWGNPNPPSPLSDQRFPANLQFPQHVFDASEVTISAVVGLPLAPSTSPTPGSDPAARHSHLPDDAAGVFFPGWDVSLDTLGGVQHLAAYGLGSPFPEDSKLCAALSTFWPAVAPDVTRTMDTAPNANLSGTVAPLTDAEIGRVGSLPWDGVAGPEEIVVGGQPFAQYNSFIHADYVMNALADKFSVRLTSKVDFREYTNRIVGLMYGYLALGVERTHGASNPALTDLRGERKKWVLLSFSTMAAGNAELIQAGIDTNTSPSSPLYRASVFVSAPVTIPMPNFKKRLMPINGRIELILAPNNPTGPIVLLKKVTENNWRKGVVKVV